MRVLLVAPRSDLRLVDEESQDILRSGLEVTPLIGEVTSRELLREIKNGDHDVLWLATHGETRVDVLNRTEYGVVLSDGFMPSSELVAQVRGKFKLVYLNTCTSYHIAQQIQLEANVTVIGTLLDVPDRQAYQTGSIFASWLAQGLTPAQAYLKSQPGGTRIYMWLAALEPSQDSIDILVEKIDRLAEKIDRDSAAAASAVIAAEKTVRVMRWLLWISWGLHIPEWIALYLLWRL